MTDETPVQSPNGRRRSTSAMLPPTTEGEPTQCQAKATGAGASLAMMATLGFLWGGACFGFNGIKTVFLDEGLFADACDHGDRCKAQINQVDAAWTFASAMLNVMALVNGSLSDALGLRRLCACCLQHCSLSRRARVLPGCHQKALRAVPVLCLFCARGVGHAPLLRRSGAAGGTGLPRAAVLAAVRREGGGGADDGDGLRARYSYFSHFTVDPRRRERREPRDSLLLVLRGLRSLLILYCACRTKARPLRRPGSGALRHVGWRRLLFAFCAALAVGANITQQGYYVATFAEQARWHGRSELLGDVLDWGFPLMALPSLYGAARFEAVWKSTSELGYPEKYCVDLREPPRHRADAATGTTSRRWRGIATPSRGAPEIDFHTGSRSTRTPSASRRARREDTLYLMLMQMAWGVLSTQKLWWLQILAVAVFVPARLLGFVHLYTCVGAFFPAEHFGIMAGACLTLGGLCAIPASQALEPGSWRRWTRAARTVR